MLKIDHLTKQYGEKKAVDDLSLHIKPGEIYGFIGHNGAGKTTTLKTINRLIDIDGAGYITLTDAGRRIATRIYERHECLTAIFVSLGVPRDIAVQDACKIEHDISEETFHALRSHFGK